MIEDSVKGALLVLACTGLMVWLVKRRWISAGSISMISPLTVFTAGVAGRYGLGSLLISLMPERYVLKGELDQYRVSWQYGGEASWIWIIYILGFSLVVVALELGYSWYSRKKGIKRRFSFSLAIKNNRVPKDYVLERRFKWASLMLLLFFCIGSISSAWTGSLDRGAGYSFWAGQVFRPEAVFIALARLKQVAYIIVPYLVLKSNGFLRTCVIAMSAAPIVLEIVSGGRGAVLYPVVMILIGIILTGWRNKRVIAGMATAAVIVFLSVPYLAAYRDSDVIRKVGHRDFVGRLGGLVSSVSPVRMIYRSQSLGREVYACSDAFLFVDKNLSERDVGFSDLNIHTLKKILYPRWLSDNKGFKKYDGSSIAQRLIGVEIDGWFPCLTTPADLLRRGGESSVFIGGVVIGIVLTALEWIWIYIGKRSRDVASRLIVLLPASYIQLGIHGTVQESIWQLAWDLPKYCLICYAISLAVIISERCINLITMFVGRR